MRLPDPLQEPKNSWRLPCLAGWHRRSAQDAARMWRKMAWQRQGTLAKQLSLAPWSILGHSKAQPPQETMMHLWKMGLPDPLQEPKNSWRLPCLAHSHNRSQGCTSGKWGSLTPFRNQQIVEGSLAWQVGTGGQLRMRQECGGRWLGKGRTDWLSSSH